MEEEFDPKDLEDIVPEDDPKTNGLPEAPASVTVRFWIDGYGVMLTMRSDKVKEVVSELEYIIGVAKAKGWKDSWIKEEKPLPSRTDSATQEAQENCPHTQFNIKQVNKEGPNKGKFFKTCVSCNKFLGWVNA